MRFFKEISPKNTKFVDNSGEGNCGYYAYAKSLLYLLRCNAHLQTPVFDSLKLSEGERASVLAADTEVERILGPKLRKLAVDRIRSEFENQYVSCNFFTALQFQVRQLVSKYPALKKYIENEKVLVTRPDYFTKADIFSVPGIKNALTQYIDTNFSNTDHRTFKCCDQEYTLLDEGLIEENVQVVDDLIKLVTYNFLQHNNKYWFLQYLNLIGTNGHWMTEEVLLFLHAAVTQEHSIRLDDGRVQHLREFDFPLCIYHGKQCKSGNAGSEGIILQNLNGIHWVSAIPDKYFYFFAQGDIQKKRVKKHKSNADITGVQTKRRPPSLKAIKNVINGLSIIPRERNSAEISGGEDVLQYLIKFNKENLSDRKEWRSMLAHAEKLYKSAGKDFYSERYCALGGRKAITLLKYMREIAQQAENGEKLSIKNGTILEYQAKKDEMNSVTSHRSGFFKIRKTDTLKRLKQFNEMLSNSM